MLRVCRCSLRSASCDDGLSVTDRGACLPNGRCASCTDPAPCAGANVITLALYENAAAVTQICGALSGPASGTFTITWTGPTTTITSGGQTIDLTSTFRWNCRLTGSGALRTLTCMHYSGTNTMTISGQDGVAPCYVQVVLGAKKRQAGVFFGGSALLPQLATVTGDPHVSGPHGEAFEFRGASGGVYAWFTAPQFVVNAMMAVDGPAAHFLTKVAVLYRGVAISSESLFGSDDVRGGVALLNEKLNGTGGVVKFVEADFEHAPRVVVDLCEGAVRVVLHRRRPSAQQVAAFALFSTTHYFNVEVEVPGCHDEFGGVLGQMYQCQYARASFKWDAADEEAFRVRTLVAHAPSYDEAAPCLPPHHYGAHKAPLE